jgi:hypothetical protein
MRPHGRLIPERLQIGVIARHRCLSEMSPISPPKPGMARAPLRDPQSPSILRKSRTVAEPDRPRLANACNTPLAATAKKRLHDIWPKRRHATSGTVHQSANREETLARCRKTLSRRPVARQLAPRHGRHPNLGPATPSPTKERTRLIKAALADSLVRQERVGGEEAFLSASPRSCRASTSFSARKEREAPRRNAAPSIPSAAARRPHSSHRGVRGSLPPRTPPENTAGRYPDSAASSAADPCS